MKINKIYVHSLLKAFAGLFLLFVFCSWGYKGHQTIGYIAERHLTPKAALAIKQLLGNQSLADVATWADQVTRQPEWRHSAPWHYVNLPVGLQRQQFAAAVKNLPKANLLQALTQCEAELMNVGTTREQKITDLKFIVHLVGDAHQPMHVSRAEDRGGNKIQVRFNGRGTNLHALWDSKLLDKQGLNDAAFAAKYDVQSPRNIALWQSNGAIEWLYESYLLSTRLYAEVGANNDLTTIYYNQHILLANKRLEIAGIRLAGLLNRLFKNGVNINAADFKGSNNLMPDSPNNNVDITQLASHYNQTVAVNTKIFGVKIMRGMALLDAGGKYPDQLLTIVLKGRAMPLSQTITGKTVRLKGVVIKYQGKPEIIITDPENLVLKH